VATVCPAEAVTAVDADTEVVQPLSLNSVTVAASETDKVTVGLTLQLPDDGVVYAVDVKVGAVVSEEDPPPVGGWFMLGLRLLDVIDFEQPVPTTASPMASVIVERNLTINITADFLFAAAFT
jgi:hypothetical protein